MLHHCIISQLRSLKLSKEVLWQSDEIAELFGLAEFEANINGVSIDSRSVSVGDLFIALSGNPGPRFGVVDNARDGHDFIDSAIAAGASAVMCRRDFEAEAATIPVDDTLDGLWQLAAQARRRSNAAVIAVTGSAGKTTMRSWLEHLLAPFGQTHASVGSFNNHWGVPLSMSRMPADASFGVFEVGTNHPGEIGPLSELVQPDVALLLNVLPAHIGNFGDMAALTDEKLAIGKGLGSSGSLIVPFELQNQAVAARVLTFGSNPNADIHGELLGDEFVVSLQGKKLTMQLPWQSAERQSGVLAALAVLHALELDVAAVTNDLLELSLPDGRGNQHVVAGVTIIDDSYNANPASMKMSLNHLLGLPARGRRIALLGEMLELGDLAESAHQEVIELASDLDQVATFGSLFANPNSDQHYVSIDEFDLQVFAESLREGDVVLVKGSNKVFWKRDFVSNLISVLAVR